MMLGLAVNENHRIFTSIQKHYKFESAMSIFSAKEDHLPQLEDVLQSPIVMLLPDDHSLTMLKVRQALQSSKHCSIVAATNTSGGKLHNIKTLYRSIGALKKLQRHLYSEYSLLSTSFIGIYPSLQYPACVYELYTNADRYVSITVLPYDSSAAIGVLKYLIGSLLGANPSVGGLGLLLVRN